MYVQQPPEFRERDKEHMVYRLHKALYGLRQTPRAWNKKIDSYLLDLGFERCVVEHRVYVKAPSEELLIISLYVDDLL